MEILIVRDDSEGRQSIIDIALDAGFLSENIRATASEAESLAIMRSFVPDMAVVDPHLTKDERFENGLNVIRKALQFNRQCIALCVTLRGERELGVRAFQAGAKDYVDLSWPRINGWELLRQKLQVWKGVLESREVQGSQAHQDPL
ncbi:MAG: response regulator [Candidatus Peribacteraceae bacterium]|nr:response regulator [Candidatus Peribacteraceae bacterium]